MENVIIVLLRQDFRIHDQPALYQASLQGKVIPLFILDEHTPYAKKGEASKWWLHQNLEAFHSTLKSINGRLWIDKGKTQDVLTRWIKETGATGVYWNRNYDPNVYKMDKDLALSLSSQGVEVKTFEGNLLLPPWKIRKEDGSPYKVYSAFYRRLRKETIPKPVPQVKSMNVPDIKHIGLLIKELCLIPEIPWYKVMDSIWEPGEKAAMRRFHRFVNNSLEQYHSGRDFPSDRHHSTLSPYLSLGIISVRSMFHFLIESENTKSETFIKQLIWRDFSYSILLHFPNSPEKPLYEKFERFQWEDDLVNWESWTKGKTGYPIVDAGMRELWATGFMHNRVRMIVASFLTKHLLIPWQKGADWFFNTLIDADLANNSMGWQWVAGSGLDASPYFRIFNPTTQSEKFDKQGQYIRRWVPELNKLPNKYIHKPSEAPLEILTSAGVVLGESYPLPIVDHRSARKRALEHYDHIK
ncbi:cryptochrome/photolyase family protein [Rossellomorea aquimaris]|uniref:cryptochrome/photolyase family protein n=1 Tax=Rossellomorea aquimaris TaxID=189382 RepID=UPI0007D08663|nr:deoxyribodipyrimidine photo-lyase [Rossellomorea aquimaris]